MYPSVELATALLFVACYLSFGLTVATAKWLFFTGLLVVLIVTDYRDRILPDEVNWFGAGLGLALATNRFAVLPTLRALLRLAEFTLRSLARPCTFPPFLRLAMILSPVLCGDSPAH